MSEIKIEPTPVVVDARNLNSAVIVPTAGNGFVVMPIFVTPSNGTVTVKFQVSHDNH